MGKMHGRVGRETMQHVLLNYGAKGNFIAGVWRDGNVSSYLEPNNGLRHG